MFDIVIVNWNSGEHLKRAVSSVVANGGELVSSLVVVDNGSTDGSIHALDGVVAPFTIKIDYCEENLGFGKACNRGARHGNARWLVFLNPDAQLMPGALQRIAEFSSCALSEGVGIVGPQNIDVHGSVSRSCSRFPSLLSFLIDSTGLFHFRQLQSYSQKMRDWDHLSSRFVDQVIGACYAVKRDVFQELGGFDERFFVYFEEVDFALRAKQLGIRTYFLARARVVHYGGGSTESVKAARLAYALQSRTQYVLKHFGRMRCLLLVAITAGFEFPARLFHAAFSGPRAIGDVIGGYWFYLRSFVCSRRGGRVI